MKKNKGFTLVELIAVIIVLVIVLFITYSVITKLIQESKLKSASLGGEGFLMAVENYSFMHSVNSSKYPLKLEPNKTYDINDIKEYIKVKGDKPTEGTVTLDENGKIKEAALIVNGYTVVCTGSSECQTILEPKIEVIVSDTWEKEKEVEFIVVSSMSGLADKPFSFDGGNTWTDNPKHTFTDNQKLDLVVKDKKGKEYREFIVCTSKKDGRGQHCTTEKIQDIYINKADSVKPTCELLIVGDEGKGNWYKSDVEIKLINVNDTGKDVDGKETVGSGIKLQDLNISKIVEDGSYEVKGTVVDKAGNVGICKQTIGRDTKVPNLTSKMTGTVYNDGYMKGSTLEVTCTDDGSGIDEKTGNQTFDTYGNKTVAISCKDKAGNSVSDTKTYRIYESYTCSVACGSYSCSYACGTTTCSRTVDTSAARDNCIRGCYSSMDSCDSGCRSSQNSCSSNCGSNTSYMCAGSSGEVAKCEAYLAQLAQEQSQCNNRCADAASDCNSYCNYSLDNCVGSCPAATTTEYYSCTDYCSGTCTQYCDSTCYR